MTINISELRKVIADCYWPTSPVAINEILDRLEAAEKDIAMKEEVIDSLATVIKRLDAQCDAAEKEREIDEKRIADLMADLNRVGHENDALRAKIERMEKQEPYCTAVGPGDWTYQISSPARPGMALYALPGAKGEEK